MGLFGNIFKVAIDLVETPIALVKDVVTMGGVLEDRGSYTVEKLQELKDDLINIDETKK